MYSKHDESKSFILIRLKCSKLYYIYKFDVFVTITVKSWLTVDFITCSLKTIMYMFYSMLKLLLLCLIQLNEV